jgi:hypothetical protein
VLADAVLSGWCESVLGAPCGRILFRRRHLSQVLAVELADGRRVVVKARPAEERIAGCPAVQAALGAAGFPCPALIAGPVRTGGLAVTAETLIPGGDQLWAAYGAMPFAALLARLIATAPPVTSVPSLRPSPPWTGWDHPGARLWPDRDDRGRDLNETPGPGWVDRAARLVREQMRGCEGPLRAGHGDWESQNIRWDDGKPLAVHDWDSVIAQPEEAIVGLAAAVWPAAGGRGQAATPAQTAEFLSAYQAAAGTSWTGRQVQMAWAASADAAAHFLGGVAAEFGDRRLEAVRAEQ